MTLLSYIAKRNNKSACKHCYFSEVEWACQADMSSEEWTVPSALAYSHLNIQSDALRELS